MKHITELEMISKSSEKIFFIAIFQNVVYKMNTLLRRHCKRIAVVFLDLFRPKFPSGPVTHMTWVY